MTKTVTLSTSTLAHHLRTAADKYDSNAQACAAVAKNRAQNNLGANDKGHLRLADQFTAQAAECRAFADVLDGDLRSLGFDSSDAIALDKIRVTGD